MRTERSWQDWICDRSALVRGLHFVTGSSRRPPARNEMMAATLDALWAALGPEDSLLEELAADAVLARARHGELRACLPRLLELATAAGASPELAVATFDLLERNDWDQWPRRERALVEAHLDQWWLTTLYLEPESPALHEVLGALVQLEIGVRRWLDPWLVELDGAGARHLVALVADGLSSPHWAQRPDQRTQVLAWTRSEPVIVGLTLVGGVHLGPGELGRALDRML